MEDKSLKVSLCWQKILAQEPLLSSALYPPMEADIPLC